MGCLEIVKRLKSVSERGIELGRPNIKPDVVKQIQYLYDSKHMTIREIASNCNVSVGTAHKYVKKSSERKKINEKENLEKII